MNGHRHNDEGNVPNDNMFTLKELASSPPPPFSIPRTIALYKRTESVITFTRRITICSSIIAHSIDKRVGCVVLVKANRPFPDRRTCEELGVRQSDLVLLRQHLAVSTHIDMECASLSTSYSPYRDVESLLLAHVDWLLCGRRTFGSWGKR
jgi:hypothetical protein